MWAPTIVFMGVFAMMLSAIGTDLPSALVRNAAAACMVLLLVRSVLRGARLDGAGGIPLALSLFSTWVTVRILFDTGFQLVPLLTVLWFPLTFFVAYTSNVDVISFKRVPLVFLAATSLMYLAAAINTGLRGAPMINAVYYVLLTLPFALTANSSRLRIACVTLIFATTFASNKRTALLSLALALLVSGVAAVLARSQSGPKRPRQISTAIITLFFAGAIYWFAANRLGFDVLEKFTRVEEDGGSGRAAIYDWILKDIAEASITDLLLGRGFDGVARATGNLSAHNDFLEVVFDFGVIGLVFYLLFYWCLCVMSVRLVRARSALAGAWAASVVLFAVVSLLSHLVLTPSYIALLGCFWGLAARAHYDQLDDRGVVAGGRIQGRPVAIYPHPHQSKELPS